MNWKDIWNKKGLVDSSNALEKLLDINGFTSDDKRLPTESWLNYIDLVSSKLNISKADQIFEAGCGAGAFLYPLYQSGHENIHGIDYAQTMVESAAKIMPKGNFKVGNVQNLEYSENSFDIILCNSVFLYLNSLDDAHDTIKEFCRVLKPGGRVAILDIPDLSKKDLAERAKLEAVGQEAYDKMYKDSNLKHQFYTKEWFKEISKDLNIEPSITDQTIKNYTNSNFRFNFFFKKL